MPEISYTRDVVTFVKGTTIPVNLAPSLLSWTGGQGVVWVPSILADPTVGVGGCGSMGFLLVGSEEANDLYTAQQQRQTTYKSGVLGVGGWIAAFRSFERYTYASRLGGPLVENVFSPNQQLFWSLRGLLTVEDELTLSGSPSAPNQSVVGVVIDPPKASNSFYLTADIRL